MYHGGAGMHGAPCGFRKVNGMIERFIATSSTTVVAWWGAVVATTVLLWDAYKWKASGPHIVVDARMDYKMMDAEGESPDTFIFVQVANRGNLGTTLTSMTFQFYATWWQWLRNKPAKSFFINSPGFYDRQLPHVLEPGATWQGHARQDAEVAAMATSGRLCCNIHCSSSDRPVRRRITRTKAREERR